MKKRLLRLNILDIFVKRCVNLTGIFMCSCGSKAVTMQCLAYNYEDIKHFLSVRKVFRHCIVLLHYLYVLHRSWCTFTPLLYTLSLCFQFFFLLFGLPTMQ